MAPHSAQVNARLNHDSDTVRLIASRHPDLGDPKTSAYQTAQSSLNNRMACLPIDGLDPDAIYYYAVESNGVVDTSTMGQFRTPAEGGFSFTIAFGACANTRSNHPVFDTIRRHQPLFFLHMGDLHYEDIGANDRGRFRQAYDTVLAQPNQAALYRSAPIVYIWDDHDYGPNDSDATAPGRTAARLTYQEYVPHYPLAAGGGDVPIYQAFTIGRVRFILTDTRSERTPRSEPDNTEKSMLGPTQKAWLKQQLLAANGVYPVIVWVSTSPWIADLPGSGDDNWAGYSTERRELADFIEQQAIQGLLMLCGDVHMLAIDDGRNNRYSTSGARGFPVMQAAPLDRANASDLPDNTYSEGQFPGHSQFGLMTIADDGGPSIHIRWSGRSSEDVELVRHEMRVPPVPRLAVSATSLSFLSVEQGPQILSQRLVIANLDVSTMEWAIQLETPAPWLALSAASGTATYDQPANVEINVDPLALDHGVYQTRLRIEGEPATYSPQFVQVTLLCTDEQPDYLPHVSG